MAGFGSHFDKYYHFVDLIHLKSSRFSWDVKLFFFVSILFILIKAYFFITIFNSQSKIIDELVLTTDIVRLSSSRVHQIVSIYSNTLDVTLLN